MCIYHDIMFSFETVNVQFQYVCPAHYQPKISELTVYPWISALYNKVSALSRAPLSWAGCLHFNTVAEENTIQSGIVWFCYAELRFFLVCLHRAIFIAVFSDLFSCGIRFECQLFGLDCYCILCFNIILYFYFILVKRM